MFKENCIEKKKKQKKTKKTDQTSLDFTMDLREVEYPLV